MKTKKQLIVVCLLIILVLSTCYKYYKEEKKIQKTEHYGKVMVMTKHKADSIYSAWKDSVENAERNRQLKRKNTIIANLKLSNAKITRDSNFATELKTTAQDSILELWKVYSYFRRARIINGDISLCEVKSAVQKYVGYKKKSMDTWGTATQKTIQKFSPALSMEEKVKIAKSLSISADLIYNLKKLNDDDLANITRLLDTIVCNVHRDPMWIYNKEAENVFVDEYNILSKVWVMPPLLKGRTIEEITNRKPGHYYILDVHTLWEGLEYLAWNTRYLNRYQYAIGMFHRRCIELKPQTSQEKRGICTKMSEIMKEAAKELLPKS